MLEAAATAKDPSTIELIAYAAQVVVGVVAIISIWIGLASLREVRRDRVHRVRPWLAFDHGGQVVRFELKQITGLPGLNPGFIQKAIGPEKREVRAPIGRWGGLKNHGGGVALDSRVTFVTTSATIGTETFSVQPDKLTEFPYDPRVNRIPTSPSHVHPADEATFFRIPTPVFECKGDRTEIRGIAVIRCSDILGRTHIRFQKFLARVETRIEEVPKAILISFNEELAADEAKEVLGASYDFVPDLKVDEVSKLRDWLGGTFSALGVKLTSKSDDLQQ